MNVEAALLSKEKLYILAEDSVADGLCCQHFFLLHMRIPTIKQQSFAATYKQAAECWYGNDYCSLGFMLLLMMLLLLSAPS